LEKGNLSEQKKKFGGKKINLAKKFFNLAKTIFPLKNGPIVQAIFNFHIKNPQLEMSVYFGSLLYQPIAEQIEILIFYCLVL
jgi:hypothetical protein